MPEDTLTSWGELERRSPELAARGREILYHCGVPLGYLATIRRDGGPRVHPFCPIVYGAALYGLIGPSPKQRDLLRDGRYAIHSFPLPDRDDEFYLTGRVRSSNSTSSTCCWPPTRSGASPTTGLPAIHAGTPRTPRPCPRRGDPHG